ncbi:unnamed protein product (macronuclear) [Paramecium tetraurelia]|uniref:Uncharacterized protein n=1 Tax=Paramecium tetraurelia TaxID=5888 RepID=A0CB30_PARTE|nr:uncharacterized protein GSPATT00036780001 [Paramecium tetraurelia]CAK67997.1 unnamed protein product [Paramecium tetraurelia]|eukprot:XP_001435394.1 hypothetical protein (macronuclear) [Paramecium tetraurelia strain d4-2]
MISEMSICGRQILQILELNAYYRKKAYQFQYKVETEGVMKSKDGYQTIVKLNVSEQHKGIINTLSSQENLIKIIIRSRVGIQKFLEPLNQEIQKFQDQQATVVPKIRIDHLNDQQNELIS